ncbi:LysE family translocator [Salinarimonas rosea]|uniref:LysE family translocator n=1 Tax=Salinarimonas rosea TaxID=552063 RepID=UPI000406D37A|nr:LysE family translocator [Salinarimonas rosea]
MITSTWLAAILLFALSTSFSPGPNNLLLVTSGAKFGLARTWRHILGIAIGFPAMVVIVGLFLGAVFERQRWLHDALAIVGSAYLLYLTWKILLARGSVEQGAMGAPIGFVEAALFQWVNPKAWVMATGAVAAYTTSAGFGLEISLIATVFVVVGFVTSTIWAAFGELIARFLSTPARVRVFNVALGLMLLASILPILLARAPT